MFIWPITQLELAAEVFTRSRCAVYKSVHISYQRNELMLIN